MIFWLCTGSRYPLWLIIICKIILRKVSVLTFGHMSKKTKITQSYSSCKRKKKRKQGLLVPITLLKRLEQQDGVLNRWKIFHQKKSSAITLFYWLFCRQNNVFIFQWPQSEWKKADINSCHSKWHNGNSSSEKS